ncbi:unnamed protein product, partial [Medioppia subpectinata]
CQSKIGRIGGKQDLQLAPNCFIGRKVTHELLHALGFNHEHSRPDRDDYVQVIMSNVKPGTEHNFEKKTMSMYKVYTKFDYTSIMLYGKTSFGKNNATTLISKQAPTNDIKYMRIMSTLDIFTLKAILLQISNHMDNLRASMCYSMVGRIGGKQDLQLAPNCFGRTIIHELLHALGFKHEHSRPDRDSYVEVIWANIKPGKEKPFQKKTMPMFKMYTKFDYSSIMLYGKKAFSKNNATTLVSKHAPTNDITRMKVMSPLDIVTLKTMYKC